jgi:hypothetical protein
LWQTAFLFQFQNPKSSLIGSCTGASYTNGRASGLMDMFGLPLARKLGVNF